MFKKTQEPKEDPRPVLRVTTTVTAEVRSKRFSISPSSSDKGRLLVTPNSRTGSLFDGMTVAVEEIPELILMLQEVMNLSMSAPNVVEKRIG